MVTFSHKVKLVQDIFVIPASYSHKPKTNGTHRIDFDFEKLLIFFNSFDFDIGFDVQK